MIAQAIDEAVEHTKAILEETTMTTTMEHNQPAQEFDETVDQTKGLLPNSKSSPKQNTSNGVIHEGNVDAEIIDEQLQQLIKDKYGDAATFFSSVTAEDGISRGRWKAALRQLGMSLSDASRKALRKRVAMDGSKMITCKALTKFMGDKYNADPNTSRGTPSLSAAPPTTLLKPSMDRHGDETCQEGQALREGLHRDHSQMQVTLVHFLSKCLPFPTSSILVTVH